MQIHNFIKTSLIDYPGKLSSVVFTQGCMWRCWFCQNAELLTNTAGQVSEQEYFDYLRDKQNWLDGVVICGGEPTMQLDLEDFIKKIKTMGYSVKLDTNGTNPSVLKNLIDQKLVDYVAMDIKCPLRYYRDVAKAQVNIDALEQSIDILKNSDIDYEFRTTALPTLTEEDFLNIANIIKGAKSYYIQLYLPPSPNAPTAKYTLANLQDICDKCNMIVNTKIR